MRYFMMIALSLALTAPARAAEPTAEQIVKSRQALTASLTEAIVAPLRTWRTEYVEKPAFPFVVDKVARRVQAESNDMISANARAVRQLLTKPQVRMHVMNAVAEAGLEATADNAMVDALTARLTQTAGALTNFYDDYVTLAVVGWGSGDHESVKGYGPSRPASVAQRLLKGVPELLFPGR
jgi:hypothetical protein